MNNTSELLKKIEQKLEDAHATHIVTIDVRDQTTITDFMIIATGRSSRHVKAVAEQLMLDMKATKLPALHATGLDQGDWVLIDFGDFIVHVMQASIRDFYDLEGLWQNKT